MRIAPDYIDKLESHQVFVFGSNTEGIHGGGAARMALHEFGAIYGQAQGLQGQSYAIVTKDLRKGMRSVSLDYIESEIFNFLRFATLNPQLEFLVTRFGCELAGFEESEIAGLFKSKTVPDNVLLPGSFIKHIV